MAKNPDYGPTFVTPTMTAYFCSVQERSQFSTEEEPKWELNLIVDVDDPKQQALLDTLLDFENERRVAHGQETTDFTTAVRGKKDSDLGNLKLFKATTRNKPEVYDQEGKPTGMFVGKGDKVIGVMVPKFNPNSFGKPTLSLYFDGVRIVEKNGNFSGGSTAALLGADLSEIEVEEVKLGDVDEPSTGDLLSGIDV